MWASQRSEPLWTTLFLCAFWVQVNPLTNRILDYSLSVMLVGDCHCMITRLGFYPLLIYKWTISHLFVEGTEPKVFPSQIINYCIKMNYIHPANMVVYFKCIYRVPGTCWALYEDSHLNKIGTQSWQDHSRFLVK